MNNPITLKTLLEPIVRQIGMDNPEKYSLLPPVEEEYMNRASIRFPSGVIKAPHIPASVQYLLHEASNVHPGPVTFKLVTEDDCMSISRGRLYFHSLAASCDESAEEGAVLHYLSELQWILLQGRIHGWKETGCPATAGETLGKFLAGEDRTIDRALSQWGKG